MTHCVIAYRGEAKTRVVEDRCSVSGHGRMSQELCGETAIRGFARGSVACSHFSSYEVVR